MVSNPNQVNRRGFFANMFCAAATAAAIHYAPNSLKSPTLVDVKSCPEQEREVVAFDAPVPPPFNSGEIIMCRGEWIQCEVHRGVPRELREERARRIYVDDPDFPDALFQLLADFTQPSRLPFWERGDNVPGYRKP